MKIHTSHSANLDSSVEQKKIDRGVSMLGLVDRESLLNRVLDRCAAHTFVGCIAREEGERASGGGSPTSVAALL